MTQAPSKIRIKIGTMELEYEGDSDFLDGGIEKLLETMGSLASKVPTESIQAPERVIVAPTDHTSDTGASPLSFTTSTLAAYTDAKSAPELALCAMFYLEKVKRQNANTRADILAEMKTATAYYKSTMSSNNSSNLKSLAKSKRINEVSSGKYALSRTEFNRFDGTIAQFT